MRFEGGSDLEVGVPDLESAIPSDRGKVRVEGGLALGLEERRVSDAGNPFGVVVHFRSEFAVSEGVPEFDSLVGSRGNNLSVVGGEGAGKDFFGVSLELSGGESGSEVPESQGLVPG